MSWRVFLAVVAVALVNVAVGLEWLSPAPPRTASLQTPIVYPTPPAAVPAQAAAPAKAPAQAAAPRPAPATTAAAEASEARAQAPSAPPGCNVSACEAHYKSFRAADCTYQPNDGPRRLCRRK
ncbi:BA14K family protein [Microbacteriaceae bacterium K1510]|nr:BA14K family protein [Microbacteriaceae bacterium K1510]